MTTIFDYSNCSTAGCHTLDMQIIAQIQKIAPGLLAPFDHLNVTIGAGCHPYLQAPAVKALGKAIVARGKRMHINSALRTIAQQAILYQHKQVGRCGIRAAAKPGLSNHNSALAIDIEDASNWRQFLRNQEWNWIGSFDPMHFDYEGSGTKNLNWISIKAFQQLWNCNYDPKLIEDGEMGKATLQALLKSPVAGFRNAPRVASTISVPALIIDRNAALHEGMQGDSIKLLQAKLSEKGYPTSTDGVFGASTKTAVMRFQKERGLDDDGVVGVGTRRALDLA